MDDYDLQARHAPVVFAFLPIFLAAFAFVPGFGEAKIQAGSIAFILLAALAFVATRVARSAGRARQESLYAAWGGQPTTAMLRYRDASRGASSFAILVVLSTYLRRAHHAAKSAA